MSTASIRLAPCRSTLLASLRACLAARGDDRDLAEVAGLTGLAFHLNVDATVSPSGVAAYPWAQELPGMVARLGYEIGVLYADDENPQFERMQEQAARMAAGGASRGMPSILFGVHLPEFGLVTDYDADRRELDVSGVLDDRGGEPRLPVARLGRGDVPVLLMATLRSGHAELDAREARLAALRHAVRRARDLGPRLGGFACGLRAYELWRAAIDAGTLDPTGHAYTLQVTAELRAGAAPFLERFDGPGADAVAEAARCYRSAADRMIALAAETPFPLPEDYALTSTMRKQADEALRFIADAEARGVDHLDRALDAARRARATASLRIDDATPDDAGALFRYIDEMPLAELPAVADELRAKLGPELGGALRAKIARTAGADVVGQLLYADLADAGAPIAARGRYLYLYYAWVARDHRRCGIGAAMIEALVNDAAGDSYSGVLAEATDQEIYLHADGFAMLGFDVVARTEDGGALMYLPVTSTRAEAEIAPPPAPPPGPLRVVVAQHRPCPLMALARAEFIAGAERARERGAELELELRDEPPNEIVVGGRRLPLTFIPAEAAATALLGAAEAWKAGVR